AVVLPCSDRVLKADATVAVYVKRSGAAFHRPQRNSSSYTECVRVQRWRPRTSTSTRARRLRRRPDQRRNSVPCSTRTVMLPAITVTCVTGSRQRTSAAAATTPAIHARTVRNTEPAVGTRAAAERDD